MAKKKQDSDVRAELYFRAQLVYGAFIVRKAIGLNDKFLMIRDLFDGDAARYEDTITTLNEFDDLDECMIYIVENFVWNPDSEGAKLLVSLIERKLA